MSHPLITQLRFTRAEFPARPRRPHDRGGGAALRAHDGAALLILSVGLVLTANAWRSLAVIW